VTGARCSIGPPPKAAVAGYSFRSRIIGRPWRTLISVC